MSEVKLARQLMTSIYRYGEGQRSGTRATVGVASLGPYGSIPSISYVFGLSILGTHNESKV